MGKEILKKTKLTVEDEGALGENYVLQLFVTGILPNSVRAIVNIKAICEKYLKGRYDLEIQ